MNTRLALAGTALVVAAFLVPAGAANSGVTYVEHGILDPLASAYVTGEADRYMLLDGAAGTIVTATVTWNDPTADLDLSIQGPGGSCDLAPEPDVPCNQSLIQRSVVCDGASADGRTTLGPTRETVTLTLPADEDYAVTVTESLGDPLAPVFYTLTVHVDGTHGELTGAEKYSWVTAGAHCRAVALAH